MDNKRILRRSAAVLAAALAAAALAPGAGAAPAPSVLQEKRDKAVGWMHGELAKKDFKYVLDWPALSLYAAGKDVAGGEWSTADGKSGVDWREGDLRRHANIGDATTDFESALIGALAAQQNPRAFGKKDLVQAVIDSQLPSGKFADTLYGLGDEFLNAHAYGIIALYAAGVAIPNEEKARDYLLGKQHADGGFHWNNGSGESDPDMTAAALLAMKALGLERSHPAVVRALGYLKSVQTDGGGFASLGAANADTASVVIEALKMWGIDPTEWKKGGGDPIDSLLSFQLPDGSFLHQHNQPATMMSTHAAVLALSDTLLGTSVYERLRGWSAGKAWQPAFPDLPFTHPYYRENIKLANLGVMAGHTNGAYGPDDRVTREQFAKILVYGGQMKDEVGPRTAQFTDLPQEAWSNPFVHVALQKKLIYGTSAATFNPQGHVTGGQLMAILVRMLGLEDEAGRQRGTQWYDGYVAVAKAHGLWYPNFDPNETVSRAEAGYSFVRCYEAQIKLADASIS